VLGMSITFLRCSSKWVCVRDSGNSLRVCTGRFVAGRGGGGKDVSRLGVTTTFKATACNNVWFMFLLVRNI
jgi:hypothetical protein